VLINGASGSVGPFAIQLASLAGAEVTGVASRPKLDFVRALGADHVVDYTREDYTRSGQRYDRILDVIGSHSVFQARRALAPTGRYVTAGAPTTWRIVQSLLCGPLLSVGRRRSLRLLLDWKPNDAADLAHLGSLVADGRLVPAIDRRYPLAELPEAIRYLAAGQARGKLVIWLD
jgi:NADPH:quinone reductase-like Zn-dependent oxidoreductase